MTEQTRERVIDKIAKMMKHKDSAEKIGSQAEAQAFAEKIQQLMVEHELEMSEIKMTERDAVDDAVGSETFWYNEHQIPIKKTMKWQWDLARAVAAGNFCRLLVPARGGQYVVFVGRSANRAVTAYVFEVLCRTALNLAHIEYLRAWKNEQKYGDVTVLRGFKQAFLQGFADAVAKRYAEMRLSASESTALVLRSADKAVDKYMEQFGKRANPLKDAKENYIGRAEGVKAGMSASLDSNGVAQAPAKKHIGS